MTKKGIDLQTVEAVERAGQKSDNTITLSSGVVLRGKQIPPVTMIQVMAAFPRPTPPVVFIETMGREMENKDDPDYLERLKQWKVENGNATLNAMIMLGTELVSKPKGMPGPRPGPKEKDWLEDYRLLGVSVYPTNDNWRYLTWVTFKALVSENDVELLKKVVGRLSGIPEVDVKAAESFPGSDQE